MASRGSGAVAEGDRRVSFFGVGVQKAGTTALHEYLRQIDGLELPDTKEAHVFDRDDSDWAHPDYGILHRHFTWDNPDVIRGEITPIYMYWPNALR